MKNRLYKLLNSPGLHFALAFLAALIYCALMERV